MARKTKAMLEEELIRLKKEHRIKEMTEDELYWFIKAEEYELKAMADVYGADVMEEEFKRLQDMKRNLDMVVHLRKRKEIYQSNTMMKKLDLL